MRYFMDVCSDGAAEIVWRSAVRCVLRSGESEGYKENKWEYMRLKKPSISVKR